MTPSTMNRPSSYLKFGKSRKSKSTYRYARRYNPVPRASRGMSLASLKPRMELKYNDVQQHQVDIADTGTFTLLNGIGVGTEVYQRTGRQVNLKYLTVKLAFTQQNGAVNAQQCRYMIVYDRQANGAVMANSDILDNSVALLWWTRKPTNPNNRDRFLILEDKTIQVNPTLLEDSTPLVDKTYNLHNLVTQYNATAGLTVASITTGSLYLVMFDQAPIGLINLRSSFACRVHYTDA